MAQRTRLGMGALGLMATALTACRSTPPTVPPAPEQGTEWGTLTLRANGEDFVRQGMTTKDGWRITFDHVYVSLAQITAAQTDPPFNPGSGDTPQVKAEVVVEAPMVVDVAAGDDGAGPVPVAEIQAPVGRFNALSWAMPPALDGPSAGYSLWLQGTATQGGQTLPFTLGIAETLAFTCGDFIGDQRKGILAPNGTADLEATFHLDHLFGDGEAPADDDVNQGALGFEPLAALAANGSVTVDSRTLKGRLSAANYTTFLNILPSLGHVGEGHCEEVQLTTP